MLRPQLKRTKVFAMMRELALELLDVDRVRLHFDHAIFKPPFNVGPTAWHQDVGFDPTHDCPVATIWFALVDATEDNGCMMFVPGSHRDEIHEHVPYGKDGRQSVDVNADKKVVCPRRRPEASPCTRSARCNYLARQRLVGTPCRMDRQADPRRSQPRPAHLV